MIMKDPFAHLTILIRAVIQKLRIHKTPVVLQPVFCPVQIRY